MLNDRLILLPCHTFNVIVPVPLKKKMVGVYSGPEVWQCEKTCHFSKILESPLALTM